MAVLCADECYKKAAVVSVNVVLHLIFLSVWQQMDDSA